MADVAENTGFKGILITIYQRVVLSYKTTLIGIAIASLGVVIDHFASSPNQIVSTIASVIGGVLLIYKERVVKVPEPDPAPGPTP